MSNLPVINFMRGVPATESFPIEEMIQASAVATRKYGNTILQYGKSTGFDPLREWLGAWHGVSGNQILCSNGSLQIVEFLCSAIIKPGDVVFIESPSYDRTITTLRKHGAKIVSIPLEADGPNIAALEEALSQYSPKFFYIIPDFQNPAGATCSLAKREALVALARQHNFFYVEDAPYRPLRYWGETPAALYQLGADVTLTMSSFSKLVGPGPRLGYAIFPNQELLNLVSKVAENTYITPGLYSHGVIYEFCEMGFLAPQIEKLKALYAPRLKATLDALDKYLPTATATRPEGGFFLSVTFPQGVSTAQVRTEAAKLNLNLADGGAFFAEAEKGANFLRLPYCAMTPDELDEGINRLAQVVKALEK
ncbi:MAG TPA: PLP-dependent aminotransferase family protein [Anaerolineales bacterium]|nr:PLP-dependent aminotransferase family protein [Anaerolineales bacterium]